MYAIFKEALDFTEDFKGRHLKTKAVRCGLLADNSLLWTEQLLINELAAAKVSRKRKRDAAKSVVDVDDVRTG